MYSETVLRRKYILMTLGYIIVVPQHFRGIMWTDFLETYSKNDTASETTRN